MIFLWQSYNKYVVLISKEEFLLDNSPRVNLAAVGDNYTVFPEVLGAKSC